jgi:hypothetical protein
MRTTKYVGFLTAAFGMLVIVVAAALPLSLSGEGPTVFHLGAGSDNCGPAAFAAFHHTDNGCLQKARARVVPATTLGLGILVVGLAMMVGRDEPGGSRLAAPRRHLWGRSAHRRGAV